MKQESKKSSDKYRITAWLHNDDSGDMLWLQREKDRIDARDYPTKIVKEGQLSALFYVDRMPSFS